MCVSCSKKVKYNQFFGLFVLKMATLEYDCINLFTSACDCFYERTLVKKKTFQNNFRKKTLSGGNSSASKTGLTLRRIVKIRNKKKLICVQKKYFANL